MPNETPNGCIPNSFQCPNLYVDRLMGLLTSDEFKVLCYAVRRILGFGKRQDRIALRQFCEGTRGAAGLPHDLGTGLNERTVRQVLGSLEGFGILPRLAENDPRKNAGAEYGLEMDEGRIDWSALDRRRWEWEHRQKARMETIRAKRGTDPPPVMANQVLLSHNTTPLLPDNRTPPVMAQPPQNPGETQLETQIPPNPPAGGWEGKPRKSAPVGWEGHWQRFLATYPKRSGDRGMSAGRDKFQRLLRDGEDPAAIQAGVERYAAWAKAEGKVGTSYVKQIPTFLNGRAWEEEWLTTDDAPSTHYRPVEDPTLEEAANRDAALAAEMRAMEEWQRLYYRGQHRGHPMPGGTC